MRDEWSDTESGAGWGWWVGGGGEAEVEGDRFSINRFAQGLVGDFLGKVLGGRAGLAVIWLINQRRWGHAARRSVLPVIYA